MCKIILFFSLLFFIFTASAEGNGNLARTYTEQNTKVFVTEYQPLFIIQLKSNPTTGYQWRILNYDKKLIEIVRHTYQPSPHAKKLMGAGGVETWIFAVKKLGFAKSQITHISFVYQRPWEKAEKVQPLIFTVTTRGHK